MAKKTQLNEMISLINRMDNPQSGWATMLQEGVDEELEEEQDDNNNENTLIITHHPPLFTPKTPTYTIHSNWDIIDGGANEALANTLKLEVIDYFDKKTIEPFF